MTENNFLKLVQVLTDTEPPRVWSLLVSVFGELAQEPAATISGPVINHLLGLIGIKPEAIRVALHRLKKDGWIDSRRIGRRSIYFLTPKGRAESAAASPRIYAPRADAMAWLILSEPGRGDGRPDDAAQIAPGLRISTLQAGPDELSIPVTAASPLPQWITERSCAPEIVAQSRDLAARLMRLEQIIQPRTNLSAPEVAALRVLIVHCWRRIILKLPDLPDAAFPDGWTGGECRDRMTRLLVMLPKPALADLEQDIAA